MEDTLKILMDNLIPFVITILGTVFLYFWKKNVTDNKAFVEKVQNEELLNLVGQRVVSYAEELGHQYFKKNDKKMPSDDKKAEALKFGFEEMERMGIPKLAADHLIKLIESSLNDTRAID